MDATTNNMLRTFLESEHKRLVTEIEEMEIEGHEALSEASGENNYRDHMADQGSATFSRELDMTLDENVREALSGVENALKRMDEGVYEACERCGAPIGEERLKAMPTATMCITCKAAEESR
ncbi:MAG: TraR/DksA family transcriptional regulator [Coriobacteriia bacterium]|nr:TraR/DksA family transcriptional regulator [Coriobacteriia bacterium]